LGKAEISAVKSKIDFMIKSFSELECADLALAWATFAKDGAD
jgi:hypothetical protein